MSLVQQRESWHPSVPRKASAGPCEPSRRLVDLGTTQAGRNRIDHSHAGFPQGLLTRRFSTYLVSYWLTNAIDRIVKETPHVERRLHQLYQYCLHDLRRGCFSSSIDTTGRCKAAVGSSPRPLTDDAYWRSEGNTNAKISEVNSPLWDFCEMSELCIRKLPICFLSS